MSHLTINQLMDLTLRQHHNNYPSAFPINYSNFHGARFFPELPKDLDFAFNTSQWLKSIIVSKSIPTSPQPLLDNQFKTPHGIMDILSRIENPKPDIYHSPCQKPLENCPKPTGPTGKKPKSDHSNQSKIIGFVLLIK